MSRRRSSAGSGLDGRRSLWPSRRLVFSAAWGIAFGLHILVSSAAAPDVKLQDAVVFGCFGGNLETMVREQLALAFEKATGVKVIVSVGTAMSNLAKVQAGKDRPTMDVYWSNELTHAARKRLGLFEKVDPKIVTNLANIYDLGKDPDGIGVASTMTVTGIEYNRQKFQEAGIPSPTSWSDLWDPRLKDRLALFTFGVAFSHQGIPIEFVYPREGAGAFANYFDVVKNAPHPKAAQAFINFLLSEDAQLTLARVGFYGPINKNVRLPPDLARKVPYRAEKVGSLVKIDRDKMNENLDEWNELWSREKSKPSRTHDG